MVSRGEAPSATRKEKAWQLRLQSTASVASVAWRSVRCSGHEGSEIVAINDLTSPEMLAYLLKYDSTQGNYSRDHEVTAGEDSITVDGKTIKIYKEADANNLLGASSASTSSSSAPASHLQGQVLCSPQRWRQEGRHLAPAGSDLKTIVYNVNHETLTADDDIISAASCTTNCLAPMAKGLNDYAPIVSGIMTTIHAYTGDQMILDGPQRKGNFRRSRAGAENIVPNTTGAAKAIGLVLPELNGKLIGAAQRVPTPTGSLTNLYAVVNKEVTVEGVNAAMKAYSEQIPETFGYNEDQIVSRDIVGMTYGSLFDATQTMVNPLGNGQSLVQVTSWYDNENSFTSQMVRTIKYFEKFVA